jgi:hypothetical protein
MLIVMAVQAEEFPVTAVRRIVIVVVILVMDRELAQLSSVEFPAAVSADPGKEFERLIAEGLFPQREFPLIHTSLGLDGDLSRSIVPQVHGEMSDARQQERPAGSCSGLQPECCSRSG